MTSAGWNCLVTYGYIISMCAHVFVYMFMYATSFRCANVQQEIAIWECELSACVYAYALAELLCNITCYNTCTRLLKVKDRNRATVQKVEAAHRTKQSTKQGFMKECQGENHYWNETRHIKIPFGVCLKASWKLSIHEE